MIFENTAWRGDTMPDDLDGYEQNAFLALTMLSRLYRAGMVSKADAAAYKRQIEAAYQMGKDEDEFAGRIVRNHAKLWKAIETAGATFNEDRTVENAMRFVEAVYGVKMIEGVE